MSRKTILRLSFCFVASFLLAACGAEKKNGEGEGDAAQTTGDATSPKDTGDCPFSPVTSPDDPCKILTCGADGGAVFVPVEVGTSCTSNNCCLGTTTTCQPCDPEDDSCLSSGLTCTGPASTQCPDDGNSCTEATAICVDDECTCRHDPLANGAECKADAQACTEGDTCQDGLCVAGELTDLTNDNPCVDLVCVKGSVEENLLDGDCTDGDKCTEGDHCVLGQCVPVKLVECPVETCFSANACDQETGACKPELKANGATCEVSNECVLLATCSAGDCVPVDVLDCDDQNDCTFDTCDPEAEQEADKCGHEIVGDLTQCGQGGKCDAGECILPETNEPPTQPTVSVSPNPATPDDELKCHIQSPSTDPEGHEVKHNYLWWKNGAPTTYIGDIVPADATGACETWECVVTPEVVGDASAFGKGTPGKDQVTVGAGVGGSTEIGPDYKVHSYPPLGGSWGTGFGTGFGSGEAVAVKITFNAEDLPYTIGTIRALAPPGQSWRGAVWAADANCGVHPCAVEVASGANVVGQGSGQLVESVLANPYTVTDNAVWVGFVSLSGDFISPAGPMYYDGDGAQGENRISGSFGGAVSWDYAASFGVPNGDWIVEIGAGTGGDCN